MTFSLDSDRARAGRGRGGLGETWGENRPPRVGGQTGTAAAGVDAGIDGGSRGGDGQSGGGWAASPSAPSRRRTAWGRSPHRGSGAGRHSADRPGPQARTHGAGAGPRAARSFAISLSMPSAAFQTSMTLGSSVAHAASSPDAREETRHGGPVPEGTVSQIIARRNHGAVRRAGRPRRPRRARAGCGTRSEPGSVTRSAGC